MNSRPIRALLFDLDGTLLDTAPDLVAALNHVRAGESMAPVEVSDFRHLVSQGALGLLREGMPASDDAAMERRRRAFLEHYADNLHVGTRAFDGVEEMLRMLQSRGIPWGIVTNKPEYLTLPLVESIGWHGRAAFIIGGDTLARRKPDPAPVLLACEIAGVTPDQAMMVGDDPRDLDSGEAAGAQVALAAYGYGAAEVLASGRALAHVIDHPLALLELAGLARPSAQA